MQKGFKRDGKGLAFVRFFAGIIGLTIVVCIGYFLLKYFDYSDKLANPDTTMRAYVEVTPSPEAAAVVAVSPSASADVVDLTATNTPEPTQAPTSTPEPTATPEPTPIATPTPVPTSIPASMLCKPKIKGFTVPDPSDNATIGITKFYVSTADKNALVQLDGYAYINDASFDGAKSQMFLIVTQKASGKQIAYQAVMTPGISGVDHGETLCANVASSDFEVCFDASQYPDGEYNLGVVIYYQLSTGINGNKNSTAFSYHVFSDSFTVTGGAVTGAPGLDAASTETDITTEPDTDFADGAEATPSNLQPVG